MLYLEYLKCTVRYCQFNPNQSTKESPYPSQSQINRKLNRSQSYHRIDEVDKFKRSAMIDLLFYALYTYQRATC